MSYKKFLLPVFILMALLQWYVPLSMIRENESVYSKGRNFKFKTEPVDPNDPFRGKYVQLNFQHDQIVKKTTGWIPGDRVYVSVEKNSKGFATIKDISKKKPKSDHYFQCSIDYIADDSVIHLEFPFQRFYMDEMKAPDAERIYREMAPDTTRLTYALVSVYNGNTALKDVIIGDSSITDIVRVRRK